MPICLRGAIWEPIGGQIGANWLDNGDVNIQKIKKAIKIHEISGFPKLTCRNAMKITEFLTFPELTLRNARAKS